MVSETQSPIAELLAPNSVLFAQVVNDLQLALIHPAANGDRQKAEWVENSLGFQSPLSRLRGDCEATADSCRSSFRTVRDPALSGPALLANWLHGLGLRWSDGFERARYRASILPIPQY